MKLNRKVATQPRFTATGGKAKQISRYKELRRSVFSTLLWEKQFHESGEDIVARIKVLCESVTAKQISDLAIELREQHHIRHTPLLLAAILCSMPPGDSLPSDTVARVIKRADEIAEFIAMVAKVNDVEPTQVKKYLSAQAKKGLARAFGKFDEENLAKYNRDGAVTLKDALFLCHAKPVDRKRDALYKRLVNDKLKTPDTWEVALSKGKDKKKTFERLIKEGHLGYLALLRNLRNMTEAGVPEKIIEKALRTAQGRDHIMPFRFIAAARAVPHLEPILDEVMMETMAARPKLKGLTVVLVDVSKSMEDKLSERSDLTRLDAAAALASIVNAQKLKVFTFSENTVLVPARRGMAGVDAVVDSQPHRNTYLKKAISEINETVKYDRIIVITDEQSQDGICNPLPKAHSYLINVASQQNGVGYGAWTHFDGFSENILKYIEQHEREEGKIYG